MQELSLNILDVAQNSVAAGATLVELDVTYRYGVKELLVITIADNGRGMSPQVVDQVTDPFYTTRTTRPVGLGIPLFKMAAELTGGDFSIRSKEGEGTQITAVFHVGHIDAAPLGDLCATYLSLVQTSPSVDFVLSYALECDGRPEVNRKFTADTRQFKEILGEVEICTPPVLLFLKEYLSEQMAQIQNDFGGN